MEFFHLPKSNIKNVPIEGLCPFKISAYRIWKTGMEKLKNNPDHENKTDAY